MPQAKRRELHTTFYKIRPEAYQAALKGEAVRLNCGVSEVRPLSPVLPLAPNGKETSRLTDMPSAVFLNIMSRLDTVDIFRATLVCHQWKNLICENPENLKRAEHAKTTHLITFTDWMDPSKTPSCEMFKDNYERFNICLIKWCCGVTKHLETVILDQSISYAGVTTIIQSCPDLNNFQIGCDQISRKCFINGPFDEEVVLPKLEFYSYQTCNPMDKVDLNAKILLSCESLRYFGAPVMLNEFQTIDVRDRLKLAFGNLVALDLRYYTADVLEVLADVDHLHFKYLGLGEAGEVLYGDTVDEITELQGHLQEILPKLTTLELLKVGNPGIGSSTIQLLTELKLNLKFVVFQETIEDNRWSVYYDPNEKPYFDAAVLTDFGQMLLSNDPSLDLSGFYFFVNKAQVAQNLREMNLGFTFMSPSGDYEMERCDVILNLQSIKRRLGIDF